MSQFTTLNSKDKTNRKNGNATYELIGFIKDALFSKTTDELCHKSLVYFANHFNTPKISLFVCNSDHDQILKYSFNEDERTSKIIANDKEKKIILNRFKKLRSQKDNIPLIKRSKGVYNVVSFLHDRTGEVFGIIDITKNAKFSQKELSLFNDSITILSGLMSWLVRQSSNEQQIKEKDKVISKLNSRVKDLHDINMNTLTQFVAGIAHEINNPLAGLKGGAEGLKENINDMTHILTSLARGREYDDSEFNYLMMEGIPSSISAIVASADRLRDLIVNLKQFSRLSIDDLSTLDLTRRIHSIVEQMKDEIEGNGIQVSLDLPDQMKIKCFSQEISMVIRQLLQNAVYYAARSEKDKRIRIVTKDKKNEVEISVLDTGCGIPEKDEDRIFQPFFTTKEIGEGMGLGLSVCYGIITKHGGKIFVDKSRDEGEGRFTTKITATISKTIME